MCAVCKENPVKRSRVGSYSSCEDCQAKSKRRMAMPVSWQKANPWPIDPNEQNQSHE
jgi:ribosomal protein L37AE/L43A